MLSPSLTTVRLFLHILAASVWVGGQIALAGVVPTVRKVSPEATKAVARAFARVAWPAFASSSDRDLEPDGGRRRRHGTTYQVTLFVKLVLVFAVARRRPSTRSDAPSWRSRSAVRSGCWQARGHVLRLSADDGR